MNFKRPSLFSLYGALTLALSGSCAQAQSSAEQTNSPLDVHPSSSSQVPASKSQLPAEMPAKPPKVTCDGSQLSIVADNATMASVFAAIHSCIGAAIDLPAAASSTRIFANLGPGPVNEVLQSLISSTDLDYVIQLSNTNAGKIEAVFLTARIDDAKEPSGAVEHASTPARRAWLQTRRNARRTQDETDSSQPTDPDAGAKDTTEVWQSSNSNQVPAANVDATPATPAASPATQLAVAPDTALAPDGVPVGSATPTSADPNAASAAVPAVAPNSVPDPNPNTTIPGTTTPTALSPADKETQDKITNMEQMFERRKQMVQTTSTPQ